MKTLSANHLSYVSGGLGVDLPAATPADEKVVEAQPEQKSYLPSLKSVLLVASGVVAGLILGYLGGIGAK